MSDFQDVTPLVVMVETDTGALAALVDDPILLDEALIEDRSNFYVNAKVRGINALKEARDSSANFVNVLAAALICYCDDPDCNAEPEHPCVSADGKNLVPVHKVRVDAAMANIKKVTDLYMDFGVKLDGEAVASE